MKFAILDGILEGHVATGLETALRQRGHQVFNTGKFGSGFTPPHDIQSSQRAQQNVNEVCGFNPDLVVVFRPATVTPAMIQQIKKTGAQVAAWLNDDPVLWNLSYKENAALYDILLHCGDEDVISFYERHTGASNGVYFPFWADPDALPYCYRSNPIDSDVVFLGNTSGPIKRNRYHALARLNLRTKIHGDTGVDYAFLNGGYLDSLHEVTDSCSRSKVAVNFPQYFDSYRGTEAWFEDLTRFSFFPYPSRLVQYAALGLPIVSVIPDRTKLRHFPEIVCVPDTRELEDAVAELVASGDLDLLSRRTHQRFMRNFSAASRAKMLEHLVADHSWRTLDAKDRADLFTQFDAIQDSAPQGPNPTVSSISKFPSSFSAEFLSPCAITGKQLFILDTTSVSSVFSLQRRLISEADDCGLPVELIDSADALSAALQKVPADSIFFFGISANGSEPVFLEFLDDLDSQDGPKGQLASTTVFFTEIKLDLTLTPRQATNLARVSNCVVRTKEAKVKLVAIGVPESRIHVAPFLVDTPFLRDAYSTLSADDSATSDLLVLSSSRGEMEEAVSRDLDLIADHCRMIDVESLSGAKQFIELFSKYRSVLVLAPEISGSSTLTDMWGVATTLGMTVFSPRRNQSGLAGLDASNVRMVSHSGELVRKFGRAMRTDTSRQEIISNQLVRQRIVPARELFSGIFGWQTDKRALSATDIQGFSDYPLDSTLLTFNDLPQVKAIISSQWFGNESDLSVRLEIGATSRQLPVTGTMSLHGNGRRLQRVSISGNNFSLFYLPEVGGRSSTIVFHDIPPRDLMVLGTVDAASNSLGGFPVAISGPSSTPDDSSVKSNIPPSKTSAVARVSSLCKKLFLTS